MVVLCSDAVHWAILHFYNGVILHFYNGLILHFYNGVILRSCTELAYFDLR